MAGELVFACSNLAQHTRQDSFAAEGKPLSTISPAAAMAACRWIPALGALPVPSTGADYLSPSVTLGNG